MTDFPISVSRRGAGAKSRWEAARAIRDRFGQLIAALRGPIERRRRSRALRLPLSHLSDAQLRDIGLRRCGDSVSERP